MSDYAEQREFDVMLNIIKKGDKFEWVNDSYPNLVGRIYYARKDNPKRIFSEMGISAGHIIIRKDDLTPAVSFGDIKKVSSVFVNSGEEVLNISSIGTPIGTFGASIIYVLDEKFRTEQEIAMKQHNENGIDFSTVEEELRFVDSRPINYESIRAGTIHGDLLKPFTVPNENFTKDGKIKSDGGKSSYYKAPLPKHVIAKIMKQLEDGEPLSLEVEDIADIMFGNDFDFATTFKSMRRLYMEKLGQGKEGNDAAYELNKVRYYTDKIEEKL